MELTQVQHEQIAPLLPVQRGNVRLPNLQRSTRCSAWPSRAASSALSERFDHCLAHGLHAAQRWAEQDMLERVSGAVDARAGTS